MFFETVLKIFPIFTKNICVEVRFKNVAGPQSEDFLCFPVINAKLLGTAFFIEHLRWLLLDIEDIPKFQEQHAAQFNFCRYEGLCPATKTEIHRECFQQNCAKC